MNKLTPEKIKKSNIYDNPVVDELLSRYKSVGGNQLEVTKRKGCEDALEKIVKNTSEGVAVKVAKLALKQDPDTAYRVLYAIGLEAAKDTSPKKKQLGQVIKTLVDPATDYLVKQFNGYQKEQVVGEIVNKAKEVGYEAAASVVTSLCEVEPMVAFRKLKGLNH